MQVEYQFSQALIDPGLLPNLFLSDYVKKVFDLYPKVMGTYSTVQGDPELRETLSQHFRTHHRLQLSADELLITSGAQQAINLISGCCWVRWIRCWWSGLLIVWLWIFFAGRGLGWCRSRSPRRGMIWRRLRR
ncbi:aminotransferase class I/II-fold pyridoxal phosphate-dependent enzyme [Paenibacillus donghaensis]|uniref:aminotransferase class I/II-fold pyridoxal phosphate-dependent enzyme n=1 Tax=Paenibacillus donghaensis TaxID=414771 RepID=UPI003183CEB4